MKQPETTAEIGWKRAEALAASQTPYLSKPTTPPLAWHQKGEIVTVILADGRKVSATIQQINALMFAPVPKSDQPAAGSEVQSQAKPEEIKKPVTVPAKRSTKK